MNIQDNAHKLNPFYILQVIKTLTKVAIEQKLLKIKRVVVQVMTGLKKVMKEMKLQKVDLNTPITYEKFIELLKDRELFMMLSTLKIDDNFIEKLDEAWNYEEKQNCSLLQNTKTTSTSCMTVPTQKDDVDVILLITKQSLTSIG